MCGLVAILSRDGSPKLGDLLAMTRALRHRGPDGEGYLADDGQGPRLLWGRDTPAPVREMPTPSRPSAPAEPLADLPLRLGLGHRRLAIVDLSPKGHQPMRRGALTVAFNGEIYDHVERRQELEALGHVFESHSDTEVLLAAWQAWGPDAFRRLNGMWALVLVDHARRKLVVARDRYGVKPLYVWQGAAGELALASEMKALLLHPRVSARPDLQAAARGLRAGPESWQAQTPFEGIQRFPAGCWAEVDLDAPGALTPQRYWSAPQPDAAHLAAPFEPRRAEQLADDYRALLDDAVRVRMRMDVRFGTALSGGLDSSQIALLVNAELQRRGTRERQEVFSSVYRGEAQADDPGYAARVCGADESGFIASVAQQLDVRSNTIEPRWQDIPAEHARMIWALEVPPANTLMSSWHTYALVAQRGVVVTLDGQGADEQLAGYVSYVRNLLAELPPGRMVREATALLRTMPDSRPYVMQGVAAHLLRRLVGPRRWAGLAQRLPRGQGIGRGLSDALPADFSTDLQVLLSYADQSAMAWSVESRMPFMDWRLVEFLAQVPLAYRIHAGWTKWLARHAMQARLPDAVLWRRDKLGWAIPESAWFDPGRPLHGWLAAQVAASPFVREASRLAGLDRAEPGLAVRLRQLNLAVWHRLYFEEPGRPGRALGRDTPLGSTP